ncbi:MAG: Omp28-related outer membrane protein [Flavobacteriales bacterium]|nr:Omp28-related outer membrane protein [Flavobacteriales bacterium]
MKQIYLLLIGVLMSFSMNAQTIVNTGPGNKHLVLEEFTGIKCTACPGGHTTLTNIVAANPGVVHVTGYNPTNSSYTNPSGTQGTDFRRSFADAFYSASYCSPGNGSRFMPSAFFNRKVLTNGNLLQSSSAWTAHANTVLSEPAELNVGIESTYNASTQELTIDVEVYYLSNITVGNSLYVLITEDDLTSDYQSGSSASPANPYVYKHTFRENVSVGQWGDAITGSTTQGSLYSTQYVFDLSNVIDPIDVSKAHVLAYVIESNSSNKEVYNGISVVANGGQASTGTQATGINELVNEQTISMFPNPTNSYSTISFNLNKEAIVDMKVYNSLGSLVYTTGDETMLAGMQEITFDGTQLPKGMYFINLTIGDQVITKKLVLQE